MSALESFRSTNVDDARRMQAAKLSRFILEQVYPFSPFTRRLLDQTGVRPQQIKSRDDLRRLPFTIKTDFLPTYSNSDGYRSFILEPDEGSIRQYAPKRRLVGLFGRRLLFSANHTKAMLQSKYQPVFMSAITDRFKPEHYLTEMITHVVTR